MNTASYLPNQQAHRAFLLSVPAEYVPSKKPTVNDDVGFSVSSPWGDGFLFENCAVSGAGIFPDRRPR
jgi:hypothetical protein